jgi:hypothetical protein
MRHRPLEIHDVNIYWLKTTYVGCGGGCGKQGSWGLQEHAQASPRIRRHVDCRSCFLVLSLVGEGLCATQTSHMFLLWGSDGLSSMVL